MREAEMREAEMREEQQTDRTEVDRTEAAGKTFKERYLAGEIEFDEIHRLTSRWGFSDTTAPLREYLGLNAEEEDVWIEESDEALKEMLDRER